MAVSTLLSQKKLKPYLLVHPNCLPDLEPIRISASESPNCVVLGDAVEGFSYENVNKAFRILMKNDGGLYSLGKGKFYKEDGELTLDVGAFTAALEYATGQNAVICGKPSADFFQSALTDMGVDASEAAMVGDDIVSDVGGAQKCGMLGILVRTGKFRPSDENHKEVQPDKIVDNLAAFVNELLA